MPKEQWGVKRVCPTTGKRFYDLNKTPIISPYTGEVVVIDLPGRKGGMSAANEAAKIKAASVSAFEGEDALLEDDDVAVEADDELLESEDDENVSFDELGDVPGEEEEL
jgi:uncharacterized protein (TIGR02300 family)